MNWQKLHYRLRLSFYNTARRIRSVFKRDSIVTEPKSIIVGATVLLGDLIMMGPLLQALNQRYPQAKITLLVPKGWTQFAKLLNHVDDAVEANLNNGTWLKSFKKSNQGRWDIAVVPFVYPLIPLFYGLGIKNILSFKDPKNRRRYQIHQFATLPKQASHMSRMMLGLLADTKNKYPAPHLMIDSLQLPEQLIGKTYAIIHPGASLLTRFWPSDRYIVVAKNLIEKGYKIVFTGSAGEMHLSESIEKGLPAAHVLNMAGKTDLIKLTHLIKGAKVVLGPDTGVLHIAKALAVPCITIMGPTQREIYGLDPDFHDVAHSRALYLADLPCRDSHKVFKQTIQGVANCRRAKCLFADTPCLLSITEKEVLQALTEIGI